MPADREFRIWALLGSRRGDNNQVLALAEALGLPFETKQLAYNGLHRLPLRLLGATFRTLRHDSRATVEHEAPDLIIAIGRRSVPVLRAIRARSGGRTKAVHIGYPRVHPRHFDLVITTPQYPVPDAANVLRLPLGLGRPKEEVPHHWVASGLLEALGPPRRLLLIGGSTLFWTLDPNDVAEAISKLLDETRSEGGSLFLLPSPRTPEDVLAAAHRGLAEGGTSAALVPMEGPPSYRELLQAADRIFVTADSVSMVSEAIATGKKVGLVPIRESRVGALWLALNDRLRKGRPAFPRDLRFFWRSLERFGLAGTVIQPAAGDVPDTLGQAVAAVRQLLELPVPPARDDHDSDPPG